ncbi:hypothetical protein OZ411_00750 [Bradyrhizobium sp. Arg237L]|uniref:nuclear transport factor 2 family protein n=1 Tax=Bradyrhizobium sp. Arg237L TaxID=3003352 RepID=UPI00249E1C8C|nr:nuclear transport factor 2 family protein [Bradyrhizobium sp. Arg237L]MDI4231340.1 hypothetical protein [Bradyrhizobium sp. Arg237L]
MSAKLPSAVTELLQALRRRDLSAFLAAFADDAVICDIEAEYGVGNIREWSDRFFGSGITVQPINAVRRSGPTIVTVMIHGADENGIDGATQLDWTLSIRDEKVSALAIARSVVPESPAPVTAFILAINTFNISRLLDSFADDAIVNDQLRECRGKAEIRAWAERDMIGNRITMYVVSVFKRPGIAVVAANVDGEFDRSGLPDPLVLSFYFTIHDEKIIQLIILRNEPDV